jgi:excisionase family DNA binding protein
MSQDYLYTLTEAAEMLKVSVDTIRRMIKRGELDAVKVGGQLRIKAASLQKYL